MSIVRTPVELAAEALVARPAPAPAAGIDVDEHGRTRRVSELVIAVIAVVVLAPVMVLIAGLVATTSRGPVLYRQHRVGAGGRVFEIVKFRTMRAGAEEAAEMVFAARDDGHGPLNKRRDDPRVTRLGRWLRRSSLDELPQLWNVINGTMALVGPRPHTPREVARFAAREQRRHDVRPGITGLTQVSGRSDLPWEEAVPMDLYYVEHRSLWLDLRILVRTIPAVFRAPGAY